MLRQVGHLARDASLIQIGGSGADHQRAIGQPARLQRTVGEPTDSHRHIPAAVDQIHLTVIESQLHPDRRMALAERRHQRRDVTAAEGQRHVHP